MSRHDSDREDTTIYKVVMNHEEQYSIWAEDKEIPLGWKDAGKAGSKEECLAYIKEVWTDMRPLSLRKKMEELARNPPPQVALDPDMPRERSLVDRLCERPHKVEAVLRPQKTPKLLKEAIDRNYVHIKFVDTKGGTELGIRLNRDACDLSRADFGSGTGTVHVEGGLTLDYEQVACIADIDLATLDGQCQLVKVAAKAEN
jgi:uncharacterized protein YbdZ (MbtH family)